MAVVVAGEPNPTLVRPLMSELSFSLSDIAAKFIESLFDLLDLETSVSLSVSSVLLCFATRSLPGELILIRKD